MANLPTTKKDLMAVLPDTSKTLHLPGLDAVIEIFRDTYGIFHVRAQSAHDAFFGQGFATAQDRLWHMDHDRRWAYGSWAAYAGEAALEQDLMMRRLQVLASVESDYQAVNDKTRAMLDAYTAGVNAYINDTEALPIEYALLNAEPESWRPWDSIAVFKARHILMGSFQKKLWMARLVSVLGPEGAARVLPGKQKGHLLTIPPGTEYDGPENDALSHLSAGAEAVMHVDFGEGDSELRDGGSNSWVVSGARTASGKPLLAGDPHRELDAPSVYYQNHISCPEFDVVGLSFPGCPGFPNFGHNAQVAWCVTTSDGDVQDLYIERFKKSSPLLYEYKGEWKQAEVRHEIIEVRGAQSVELDVTVTDHGPIIVGDPASGYAVAIKWPANAAPNLGLEPIRSMLEPTNLGELDESMREWTYPNNNFLSADVHGDIGYLNRSKLPVRSIANGWLPVPGWTGEHEWQGFVPFEEWVRHRNPESGYIVSTNNMSVGEEYPHFISLNFAPEYGTSTVRSRRIIDRLKALNKATVEEMASIHGDKVSIPARIYTRLLAHVEPLDEPSAGAKERLAGWDGTMDAKSVAATIYSAFRVHLDRMILRHVMGPMAEPSAGAKDHPWQASNHILHLHALFVTMAKEGDTSMLPPGSNWSSLLAQALAEGVAYLSGELGDDMDSWTWGTVHYTRPQHNLSASFPELATMLNPPSLSVGGDRDTPQSGGYSTHGPFTVTGTAVGRLVFDTSDWNNSAWIVPLGASGHPGSPHYADQAPIWGELKLIPMLYDWDRIAENAVSRQELRPGN